MKEGSGLRPRCTPRSFTDLDQLAEAAPHRGEKNSSNGQSQFASDGVVGCGEPLQTSHE